MPLVETSFMEAFKNTNVQPGPCTGVSSRMKLGAWLSGVQSSKHSLLQLYTNKC